MTALITNYLPWLLSFITIVSTMMAGDRNRWAWALSAANQVPWFIWIVSDFQKNQGLLPMNLVLALVFIWNHFKWSRVQS